MPLTVPVMRLRRQLVLRLPVHDVVELLARLRRLPLIEPLAGEVVEGALVRRMFELLLPLRHELRGRVQRLLVLLRGLLQRVEAGLPHPRLAPPRGGGGLRLFPNPRGNGAAPSGP